VIPETIEISYMVEYMNDLQAKVQYLVDLYKCEEGRFTFPDGDTWWQTGKEPNGDT
jgi:hypothetical protein